MIAPPLKPPSSTCPVCTELPGMASAPGAARDDTLPDTQRGASDADEFPLTQQPDTAADATPPNLTAELRRRRTGHGLTYAAMTLPIFFPTKTLKDGSPRDAYHTYGRHPAADVPIANDEHRAADGQLISAYHFLLYSRASGVYIVDTSRTGTLVNGKLLGDAHRLRVEGGVLPCYDDVKNIGYGPLKNGWQISLGRTTPVVYCVEAQGEVCEEAQAQVAPAPVQVTLLRAYALRSGRPAPCPLLATCLLSPAPPSPFLQCAC